MLRQMLWEIWRSLLAVLAAVAWLVAWIALAWMLVTDPYRAEKRIVVPKDNRARKNAARRAQERLGAAGVEEDYYRIWR